jgi:hypothetical protein
MRSRPIIAIAVTLLVAVASASAFAQQQASVIGVVTDATQAVFPGRPL